jgi:hypothetical protein
VILPCATAEDAARLALAIRDAVEPFWLELAPPVERARGDVVARPVAMERRSRSQRASPGFEARGRGRRRTHPAGWRGSVRGAHAEVVEDAAGLRARLAAAPARGQRGGAAGGGRCRPRSARWSLRSTTLPAPKRHRARRSALRERIVRVGIAEARAVGRLVDRLRPEVVARGGHLVVERAGADVKLGLAGNAAIWGDAGSGLGLMRAVKGALDPGRMFSPGRLPGGI